MAVILNRNQIKNDKFHRAIDCTTSKIDPTRLQAVATQDGLNRMGVESIELMDDEGYADGHNETITL